MFTMTTLQRSPFARVHFVSRNTKLHGAPGSTSARVAVPCACRRLSGTVLRVTPAGASRRRSSCVTCNASVSAVADSSGGSWGGVFGCLQALYTLPPGATPQQALFRSTLITSLGLSVLTAAAVIANPRTRALVHDAFKSRVMQPFENNPGLWMKVQTSLAWLLVVVAAALWTQVTGQTSMLNLIWIALFAQQIMNFKPKAAEQTMSFQGDAAAATGGTSTTASDSGAPPLEAYRSYADELTFRSRFPQLETEALVEVLGSCMFSEWAGVPGGEGGRSTNNSGKVYITKGHVCFNATMTKFQKCIPIHELSSMERIASGPLAGVRLQDAAGQYFDISLPAFGATADMYEVISALRPTADSDGDS